MAKPNKTVGAFRRANPKPIAARAMRSEFDSIIEDMRSGKITAEEAARRIAGSAK